MAKGTTTLAAVLVASPEFGCAQLFNNCLKRILGFLNEGRLCWIALWHHWPMLKPERDAG